MPRRLTPDQLAELRAAYPERGPHIAYRVAAVRADMPLDDGDGDEQGRDQVCPACGSAIPDDADICPNCGAVLSDYSDDDRAAAIEQAKAKRRDAAAGDADRIPVAISSEHPVLRYDWWSDEEYYEVLDHSPRSIDMTYAAEGLPFMSSHRAFDADALHGIVEDVRATKARRLTGMIRASSAPQSQQIAKDMRDGIRRNVSVGYIVGDEFTQERGGADGIPVRRYTSWMPIEVSTVPVPADPTVGIGRALGASGQAALSRFLQLHPATHRSTPTTTAPKAKDGTMPDNGTAPGGATVDVQAVHARANEEAAQRVQAITSLATEHKMEDRLADWLRAGASVSDVTKDVNTELSKRLKEAQTMRPRRGVEVDDKTHQRFSFARAIIAADPTLQNEAGRAIDLGLERELMQEARSKTPQISDRASGIIPFVTRANIDSATSTTGGPFKFTQPGDFIDLLRNATSVMRAGARVLGGLNGPVSFPKQTGAATANWVGENPGSDMSRSNLVTSTVSLAFKTIQAASAVSRQALFSAASGNYDLEAIIREDLAKIIALGIDLGALNGLGSSNQPLGVLQDTNVGAATALGTNGGTIAWTNIVNLETTVAAQNATGRMSYLTNAKQRGQARQVPVLGNTVSGVPAWQGSPTFPDAGSGGIGSDGVVNGYTAYVSNQVPSNLTKGTATTVCSAWIFGAFEQLMIGQFGGGFEVLVDPYTLKLQNMVDLTAWAFVDVANRYPVAFATLKDAL